MTEPRRLVLDVDVGIDDALMMLYLLSEPEVEIVAIGATHGNCTAADSARNALRTLEAVGVTTVPVALGLESPLETPLSAPQVHGYDGLGDIGLPEPVGQVTGESAVDQLVRLVADNLAVLAGAGFGFVGIYDEEARATILAFLGHEGPFHAGGEARAAAPAQARRLDVGDHLLGRDLLGEDLAQRLVAAALLVVGQVLSLIHISEPTRLLSSSYAGFCLKKKTNHK